ncbi:hypothetical protein, partial [Klebsiella pneumoniae]|uniref:hypothetical protein n=1 Tax=Klebsiella pneumoniae TaxID=573 RepID=UPI003D000367
AWSGSPGKAERRDPGNSPACAVLSLYAGSGVAATRHTGGSLAVAMPGGATLARAYGSSAMVGLVR